MCVCERERVCVCVCEGGESVCVRERESGGRQTERQRN